MLFVNCNTYNFSCKFQYDFKFHDSQIYNVVCHAVIIAPTPINTIVLHIARYKFIYYATRVSKNNYKN